MEPPSTDHDCPLVPVVNDLSAKLQAALDRIEKLERQRFGKKSEKMPPPATELRKTESPEEAEARRLAALEKRQERAALKKQVEAESIRHAVPEAARSCPKCGGTADRPVGDGKTTTEYEYLPGRFKRIEHTQEKLACGCGKYIASAPPPPRALDKGLYGPGFIAHLVTMKCADALPLHRLAKQYQRVGIPMSRSTLNDLFHATAIKLTALSGRLLQVIAESRIVLADETPMVMQRPNRRGYVWTFIAGKLIAYRFSASRSGKTAAAVLGGTKGALVVDAYTGYNRVTEPEGRERAGCNAHARRGFFDALSSAPIEARKALDLFLEVYRVEHEAKARGIVRTAEHVELRKTRSRDAMERLRIWLLDEQPRHPPKSPLGQAISYTINQWKYLTRFLDDVELPVDNNQSEGALRIVALGRKNFLFVGDEESGEHLARLYSLVSTCEANGVDPIAYLRDVLMRIDTHPAARIDELLPHNWGTTSAAA